MQLVRVRWRVKWKDGPPHVADEVHLVQDGKVPTGGEAGWWGGEPGWRGWKKMAAEQKAGAERRNRE